MLETVYRLTHNLIALVINSHILHLQTYTYCYNYFYYLF